MTHLTEQQEAAMATFSGNLHLPNGGFHKLIIELSKEYQLPFQKVRAVLKKAQKTLNAKYERTLPALMTQYLAKRIG